MSGRVVLSGGYCFALLERIAIAALLPRRSKKQPQLSVSCTSAQQGLDVLSVLGKKTSHHFAVRGETKPGATAAERFGDRRDDAKIASAIDELVIHRRRAPLLPPNLSQRIPGVDFLQDLFFRDKL